MRYLTFLFCALPCFLFAQYNLTKEALYYKQLFELSQQLKKGYSAVSEIKDKSSFFREAVYKIYADKPFDLGSGSIVTDQLEELYNFMDKVVEEFDLPVIENIPETLAPYDGSREAVSQFLTGYTENATYYHTKLKIYKQKQRELDILEWQVRELKIENSSIAQLYVDLFKNVPLTIQIRSMVNDWVKLESRFSKQLGNMRRAIVDKKKKWTPQVDQRLAEYNNYKSNLELALDLEKESLQEAYNEAVEELKRYEDEIKTVEERIVELEGFIVKIETLEKDIEHYAYQIDVLNENIESLNLNIEDEQENLRFIKSDAYLATYTTCPQKNPYDKCRHSTKTVFDNRRKVKIKHAEERIADMKKSITTNLTGIDDYQQRIKNNRKTIAELKEALLELPERRIELAELQKEREAYLERIDVYYIFKLIYINKRNSESVQNLPNTL